MVKGRCTWGFLGWWLLIIGGLNWGLVGLGGFFAANWNVVNMLLGNWPTIEWIVYILVGLAAVMELVGCRCSKCKISRG